jgi:hypothetical protein
MAEEQVQDPYAGMIGDFGTRLNEIESKQKLLKERILLIGENLISTKEDSLKQDSDLKKEFKRLDNEIRTIKRLLTKIVHEISNFSRRAELEILEKQMKMFQPLNFARIEDVQRIVQEELSKGIKKKKTLAK